jgi:DinB family protein
MSSSTELNHGIEQIRFARWYTTELLGDIPQERWFEMPAGAPTHVAWQVGHLASAQYFLILVRVRGERPDDEQLIPASFRQPFFRGSVPSASPADYPAAEVIRAVFDRVHEQVLADLQHIERARLGETCERPHRFANTRLKSLLWCSQHELVHAGQIGLLRRLLGQPPQW